MIPRLGRAIVLTVVGTAALAGRAEADCSVVSAANASFGSTTSFAVQSASHQTSTTNAGLNCSGAVLAVMRVDDHIYATITSAQGGLKGPTNDLIPYTIYGDSTTTYPIPTGVQYDYASGPLLNLLGLFGGPSTNLPMWFRTTAGANVAAGTYTDTLTIAWAWNYCKLVGAFSACLGRDIGSGTSTFQISMVVTNACQVTSAPNVSFGQAPTARTFNTVVQSVSVLCTKSLAVYSVGLDPGQHASSNRRRMANGGQYLEYDIFKAGGAVWGVSGGARVTNTAPADGVSPQSFPYNVTVYADQTTPPVGVYSDLVVVDVTF